MFALQIGLVHLFVTGLVTLQASIWKVNYPDSHRGRIIIMQVIPGLCAWFAIRYWAPHFDCVGVLRFRVVNCGFWIAAYVCVTVTMLIIGISGKALLWVAVPILVLGRALKGTAHGGGTIAWSLGHLHFARPHQVDLYMSIHVALTGLRALLMPLLGALANQLLGSGSFAIAIAISLTALLLFRRLAHEDPAAVRPGETQARQREAAAAGANVT